MARYRVRFFDMAEECYHRHISVDAIKSKNTNGFIQIVFNDEKEKDSFRHIWLDKSTAIKFAKTLRTEINKITESEVDNG
tara:strand:+ start:282 stop:521 length:240 start_codon:yes stop_codon:yes gene_type:complete